MKPHQRLHWVPLHTPKNSSIPLHPKISQPPRNQENDISLWNANRGGTPCSSIKYLSEDQAKDQTPAIIIFSFFSQWKQLLTNNNSSSSNYLLSHLSSIIFSAPFGDQPDIFQDVDLLTSFKQLLLFSYSGVEKLQLLVIVSGYYDARKNFKVEIDKL